GVAAELTDVPRQVLAAVAALDDAVLPVVLQHLGGDARRARVRERAEIADAGVNVELAVRRDAHQAVEAVESGRVISLADADAGDLRSLALPAALAALVPVEALGTFRERFLQVHARDRPPVGADPGARFRRIDAPDLEAVDVQRPGS